MAIELVTKFAPYVDEIFTKESKKALLTNDDFAWDGAHTVKVYSITTAEMNDYGRSAPAEGNWSRYGAIEGLEATTQSMAISKDRSFTFAIDKMDEDETMQQLAAGTALARQTRQVVVPEIDTYIINAMCKGAGTTPAAKELTASNIYLEIITANSALDDSDVPETDRVIVVTPSTYLLMKQCKDIVMETDIGNDLRMKGVIAMIDGAQVVKVPAARVPEKFGFLVAHPVATVAPLKLEDYKIHQDPPGISGSLVEGRIVYDAFVLGNKKKAVYYQATT